MPTLADRPSDLLIKQQVLELLPKLDAVILDVDGVIVDVSGTFRVVVCDAAQSYCERFVGFGPGRLLLPPQVELFKRAGGFSRDWDVCAAVVLLYVAKSVKHGSKQPSTLRELSPTVEEFAEDLKRRGGGLVIAQETVIRGFTPEQRRLLSLHWNHRVITQICEDLYAGDRQCERLYGRAAQHVHGAGLCEQEPVLLQRTAVPANLKLGLLTGRTREEARFALERAQLLDLIPEAHWVTSDDGTRKPEGRGLWFCVDRMQCKLGLYIGDTLDDLLTVKNYRQLKFSERAKILGALVLSGPAGALHRHTSLERGADIVAPDVNAILQFLQSSPMMR